MTRLLSILASLALAGGLAACGGGDAARARVAGFSSAAQASTPTQVAHEPYMNDGDAEKADDHDIDNSNPNHEDGDADSSYEYDETYDNGRYRDGDDRQILSYGRVASASDAKSVSVAVKRYYAAAAAGDGKAACAMLLPSIARSVVEDYGSGAGPPYLRGASSCPAVMVRVFKHAGAHLTGGLTVTSVRIEDGKVLAFFGSDAMSASDILVVREQGVWKIGSLLGMALP